MSRASRPSISTSDGEAVIERTRRCAVRRGDGDGGECGGKDDATSTITFGFVPSTTCHPTGYSPIQPRTTSRQFIPSTLCLHQQGTADKAQCRFSCIRRISGDKTAVRRVHHPSSARREPNIMPPVRSSSSTGDVYDQLSALLSPPGAYPAARYRSSSEIADGLKRIRRIILTEGIPEVVSVSGSA